MFLIAAMTGVNTEYKTTGVICYPMKWGDAR